MNLGDAFDSEEEFFDENQDASLTELFVPESTLEFNPQHEIGEQSHPSDVSLAGYEPDLRPSISDGQTGSSLERENLSAYTLTIDAHKDYTLADDIKLFGRALFGDKSSEVEAWQMANRKRVPQGVQNFVGGVSEKRRSVNQVFKDTKDKLDNPVTDFLLPDSIEGAFVDTALFFSGGSLARKGQVWLFREVGAMKGATIARNGGKYAGEYESMLNQTSKELSKTAKSHGKNIRLHENKIKNPRKYDPNWDSYDAKKQGNNLHHWRQDAERARVYERLANEVLQSRLNTPKPDPIPNSHYKPKKGAL